LDKPLNNAAVSLLRECNGNNNLKQIIFNAAKHSVGDTNDFIDKTTAFFLKLSKNGLIFWADAKTEIPVKITDIPDFCYPNNIVFELTDFYNLNYKRCYRNSSPSKTSFANAKKIIKKIWKTKTIWIAQCSLDGQRTYHASGFCSNPYPCA
jgi:hypothetical protein